MSSKLLSFDPFKGPILGLQGGLKRHIHWLILCLLLALPQPIMATVEEASTPRGRSEQSRIDHCLALLKGQGQQYSVREAHLDETLSPEMLALKNNPEALTYHIRKTVGYDYLSLTETHVDYFAALIPHFLNILNSIPTDSMKEIENAIGKVKQSDTKDSYTRMALNLGSYSKEGLVEEANKAVENRKVNLVWFNIFVFKITMLESLHFQGDLSETELNIHFRNMADVISNMEYSLKEGLIPLVAFNVKEAEDFFPYWNVGFTPLSVLDGLSGHYDGSSSIHQQLRFGFLVHDLFHAQDLSTIFKELREIIPHMVTSSQFNEFEEGSPVPAHFVFTQGLKSILEKSKTFATEEQEFLSSATWLFFHEPPGNILVANVLMSLFLNKGLEDYMASAIHSKLISQVNIISEEDWNHHYIWTIPKAWRTSQQRDENLTQGISDFTGLLE